ncbi:hypothetical protein EDB85DRAFT_2289827 [Lactarius pseudohatsudake]|nr:hypothetical protein EDB85DRAFT_2289827 [Lactarius pseudohatsudake]
MAHKTPHAPMRTPSQAARPAADARVPHEVLLDESSSSVVRSVTGDELPVADAVTALLVVASAAATVVCNLLSPSCGDTAFFFRASTRVQRSSCVSAKATAADACAFSALPAGADVANLQEVLPTPPSSKSKPSSPHCRLTPRKPVVATSTFRHASPPPPPPHHSVQDPSRRCAATPSQCYATTPSQQRASPHNATAVSTLHRIPPQLQLNTAP